MDVHVIAERDDDGKRWIVATAGTRAGNVTRSEHVVDDPPSDELLDDIACQIACRFTELEIRPPSTWVIVHRGNAALEEYFDMVMARHAEHVAAMRPHFRKALRSEARYHAVTGAA
jgi:hypothetical protein